VQLIAQLAMLRGWGAAIASFEVRLKPFVTDKIARRFPSISNDMREALHVSTIIV
jgi:hypothetical protein